MPNQLKTLDSVGGFSVDKTILVNETKDLKNVNSFEVKNSFYSDSSTSHYILRGINSSTMSVDDSNTIIFLPSNTINFVESQIIAVNDNASGVLSQKLETALSVDTNGSITELSSMTTIIRDGIPIGETWEIVPFTSGVANRFSYSTTRAGTIRTVKWVAYTKVVSIAWL